MNDEFNSSHLPEISLPTSEFNPACQIDEAFGGRLPADRAAKKAARQGKKKKKKALKVLLVTSAVAATAVTAGPLPFFEEEIAELWSEIEHGEHERHHRDSEDGEFADYWFPSLSNLEPNGYAEGWGVMDEDYIILYDDEGRTSIHLNEAWADENYNPDGIEGCRYDPDTNTLYLEDFTGTNLEANLMGNGFTISLSGENHLDSLTVWGWYYGGSEQRPDLTVGADVKAYSKRQGTEIYPFYRNQDFIRIDADVFVSKDIRLGSKSVLNVGAHGLYHTGSGTAKEDGMRAQATSSLIRSFDMWLDPQFEFDTASRAGGLASIEWIPVLKKAVTPYVRISDSFMRLLQEPVALKGKTRNVASVTVGIVF